MKMRSIQSRGRVKGETPLRSPEAEPLVGSRGKAPLGHSFARGWKISAISTPKKTAALMPAAVFVRPPVNAPKMPISCTARFTPVTSA